MNRIDSLFGNDPHGLLSVYFCAGFPTLESAPSIIRTLERNGVNMIEIGIPFSDPMADGLVIQNASCMALRNGMSLKLLFSQLADIRKDVKIPLLFMGYLNPIYRYGFENFCRSCKECGIDGAIIPDLPFRDYENEYKEIADRYDIRIIMLITPETSDERIRSIDSNTNGFIYMVSSASTTGAQKDFNDKKTEYFKHVASLNLKNPRMVGFGISNKQTFDSACSNAAGGIIGSHFLTLLGNCENPEKAIEKLRSDIGF